MVDTSRPVHARDIHIECYSPEPIHGFEAVMTVSIPDFSIEDLSLEMPVVPQSLARPRAAVSGEEEGLREAADRAGQREPLARKVSKRLVTRPIRRSPAIGRATRPVKPASWSIEVRLV